MCPTYFVRMNAIALSALIFPLYPAEAQSVSDGCDAILAPRIERTDSDSKMIYGFLEKNVSFVYDYYRSGSKGNYSLDTYYDIFGLVAKSSNSSDEFIEKIRQSESYKKIDIGRSDLIQAYKVDLSPEQVREWGSCKFRYSESGFILAHAANIDAYGYQLNVSVMPPLGQGRQTLKFVTENASIRPLLNADGTDEVIGRNNRKYIVSRTDPNKPVRVLISAQQGSDAVYVDFLKRTPVDKGPRPQISERRLRLKYSYRMIENGDFLHNEANVIIPILEKFNTDKLGIYGCVITVEVNSEGYYKVSGKNVHNSSQSGFQDLKEAATDTSLGNCSVRATPADDDELLQWSRPEFALVPIGGG